MGGWKVGFGRVSERTARGRSCQGALSSQWSPRPTQDLTGRPCWDLSVPWADTSCTCLPAIDEALAYLREPWGRPQGISPQQTPRVVCPAHLQSQTSCYFSSLAASGFQPFQCVWTL